MKLSRPFAPFLTNHGIHGIVPKHVLGSLSAQDINTAPFNSNPTVSNGAFKFVEWVKQDHVTMAANRDYYRGAPYVDQYVFRTFPAEADLVNALKTGEMDGGRITAAADFVSLQSAPDVVTYTYPDNGITDFFFQLDPRKSPAGAIFADRTVRQALVWALDRGGMANGIYDRFGGIVPDSVFATVSWAYNAHVSPKYTYNPQKAVELLSAAGWTKNSSGILSKNGQPLKFTITAPVNAIQYTQCAQAMQSNWKDIGCDVSLNIIQYAQLLNIAYFTRNFDIIIPGYGFNPDPDPSATFHSRNIIPGGLNAASYSNPQLDTLLDDAVATTDQARRRSLYAQVANILATDLPMVPMVLTTGMFAYSKRAHGIGPKTVGTFTNVVNRPFANQIWVSS
jgi:peptide/nickel transport system substrate-binding protein